MLIKINSQEIIMSLDLHTSKVQEDIDLLIPQPNCESIIWRKW